MDISKPAGFGIRLLASSLDVFILIFASSFIFYIFSGKFSTDWTNGVVLAINVHIILNRYPSTMGWLYYWKTNLWN